MVHFLQWRTAKNGVRMMPTTDINELFILRAIDFAARKHRDQRRKDEEASPYINHPISVSLLLAEVGNVIDPRSTVSRYSAWHPGRYGYDT